MIGRTKVVKIFSTAFASFKKRLTFAPSFKGVLAHLARARHWQCRGERFESAILHKKTTLHRSRFFVFYEVVSGLLVKIRGLFCFIGLCQRQNKQLFQALPRFRAVSAGLAVSASRATRLNKFAGPRKNAGIQFNHAKSCSYHLFGR